MFENKITFKKGNRIQYLQDMNFFNGVPHDVEFTIESIDKKKAVLSVPGYGGVPYGNGKIRIYNDKHQWERGE